MQGDFTRDSFVPEKHFLRVLMQQGRVQLDADWNEQVSILLHYMQTLAADLIGPHSGPAGACGFAVTALENGDFAIGSGRYYVDGILCENLDNTSTYNKQPDYPKPTPLSKDHTYLAYLDVWERLINPLQDESIHEVALGDADTACRSQVVWQVKVQPIDSSNCTDAAQEFQPLALSTVQLKAQTEKPKNPAGDEPCVVAPEARYRGLENRLYRVEIHTGNIGADGKPDASKTPTFKWSRDNASQTVAVRNVTTDLQANTSTVYLAGLSCGCASPLAAGDWVELADDDSARMLTAGPLLKIVAVDRMEQTVTLAGLADKDKLDAASGKHPLLRRWDFKPAKAGPKQAEDGALKITEGQLVTLEDGIQIQFETDADAAQPGIYRSGDYWLIPARVETGGIEWPVQRDAGGTVLLDVDKNPMPLPLQPHGAIHHYAPLAILRWSSSRWQVLSDCRNRFAPLAVNAAYMATIVTASKT